jgi:hypothetical protein
VLKGSLQRCAEFDAVLAIVEIMARTTGGTWAAMESFGVYSLLTAGVARPDLLLRAKESINDALRGMAVTTHTLTDIRHQPGDSPGEHLFLLKFLGKEQRGQELATITMVF